MLECDERTVYRYRDLLNELGYLVELNDNNGWYLPDIKERYAADLTVEEMQVLRTALSSLPAGHPLRQSIHRKLFKRSELLPFADELAEVRRAQIISILQTAISTNRVVKLRKYFSANSNTITDRVVEPLEFDEDFSQLTAWEPALGKMRFFKTTRIDAVELLPGGRTYSGSASPIDIFKMSGEPFTVKMLLSKRAYSLLTEEYPGSRAGVLPVEDEEFPYRFVMEMRAPDGIGRFVLGLPGEVLVEEPSGFIDYLKERA
ncbi:MAG: helix-turn-helix transcriptional regulator, partial [Saprospiraceae bacterium]